MKLLGLVPVDSSDAATKAYVDAAASGSDDVSKIISATNLVQTQRIVAQTVLGGVNQ